MKRINIQDQKLTKDTLIVERNDTFTTLQAPKEGGGISLPGDIFNENKFLTFDIQMEEEHSLTFHMLIFTEDQEEKTMEIRIGVLPRFRTRICIERDWLKAEKLFPAAQRGGLKIVCHGRRVDLDKITEIRIETLPSYHPLRVSLTDLRLTDEYPDKLQLPKEKLIDEFGQNKKREWKGKTKNISDIAIRLEDESGGNTGAYPDGQWTEYGGFKGKSLSEGSGYFSKCKKEGRWYLVDPKGYAFFSIGPDCVNVGSDCRIDSLEGLLDWLPSITDKDYQDMYRKIGWGSREGTVFSFQKANLYRGLGKDWYEKWQQVTPRILKQNGMNTLGNWSDENLFGKGDIPYVTSLPQFPDTKLKIFRDFPDVYSDEYREEAVKAAKALGERRDDPWMIGYFLRNEPSWAFVENLVLADEVLYHPEMSECKKALINFLQDKYPAVEDLNRAFQTDFAEYEELYSPQKEISRRSPEAEADMREFSRMMLKRYVEIPCEECRKVDPNHMILGMRWAWVSDPDLIAGWESFDVFSINCYAVDPTSYLDNIVKLGVDLPIMIGEFHYGALDGGLTATGLEGVKTQKDRGIAYRYYVERVAAHLNGVGCHYFQCYDQFALGRFDGENYNIGLFDICFQAYEEMMEEVVETSKEIYPVMSGEKAPVEIKAESIPMIAY